MMKTLSKASRESAPPWPIEMCGRLHDSALGAIYYAKARKCPEDVKDKSLIVKTIDLSEQNVYAVALNASRTILRDFSAKDVLYLQSSKKEARLWYESWCLPWADREQANIAKVAWLTDTINRDGATKLIRLNEYLNEAMVGHILASWTSPTSRHFVKTYGSWIADSTGFIMQEYAGTSLLKNMADLTFDQFKSIIVQVLLCLAEAQEHFHLKHHDVHLDNVFISKTSDEVYEYSIGSDTFKVKNYGILVRLGDYGLSAITDPESKTRFERVDYEMLDAGDVEWGKWCGSLEGQRSYDAVTFLSKFFLRDESGLCPDHFLAWARRTYKEMKQKWPDIECSTNGRPFRNREGNAKIVEILKLPVFNEYFEN
jgi:hypothetical protein